MGQFSWFTQDTKRRIRNGVPFTVYMTDDKGIENVNVEEMSEAVSKRQVDLKPLMPTMKECVLSVGDNGNKGIFRKSDAGLQPKS